MTPGIEFDQIVGNFLGTIKVTDTNLGVNYYIFQINSKRQFVTNIT